MKPARFFSVWIGNSRIRRTRSTMPGLAGEIAGLTAEHLELVLIAMLIAIGISIPTGVWLTRRVSLSRWVVGFANVLQTIPSLALFGFLIPVPLIGGIGKRTAIVALVL